MGQASDYFNRLKKRTEYANRVEAERVLSLWQKGQKLAPQQMKFRCCEKAKVPRMKCVCIMVTVCPVHGEKHIGTHD